uniref:MBD domain-containing protein n=1 Tax=Strigamia maritima TaxID=126957 RepID=T1J5B8_STRMM
MDPKKAIMNHTSGAPIGLGSKHGAPCDPWSALISTSSPLYLRPLSIGHLRIPGTLAYVHIPKPDRKTKLEPRALKGVMVGYVMSTRGYRVWDPISNNVYESKHVKFDKSRIYKDVVQTYVGDTPLETSDGRDIHFISHDESGDSDDDEAPAPTPINPPPSPPKPLKPPLPTTPKPKPFTNVTSRRKVVSTTTKTQSAPSRVAFRTPVPNKVGWEREEVKRQTGITRGKWDVYFYAPGRQASLRSRPEVQEFCEKELRVRYNPNDFNWVPSHETTGHESSEDENDLDQPRKEEGGDRNSTNDPSPIDSSPISSDDAEAHIMRVY